MKNIIVDTSVVVKWFSNENDSNKARIILDLKQNKDLEFFFPQSIILEILSAFFHSKRFSQQQTEKSMRFFLALHSQFIPIDELELAEEIIEIVYKAKITSYDAAFVALANRLKIPLVTADYKHHNKSISPHIVWLSEWKS